MRHSNFLMLVYHLDTTTASIFTFKVNRKHTRTRTFRKTIEHLFKDNTKITRTIGNLF